MVIKKRKIQSDRVKREVCFLLNKEFYNLEEIEEALKDFKGVCEGKIEEGQGKRIKILLKSKDLSILETLEYEFCNYSLGLMKNNRCI